LLLLVVLVTLVAEVLVMLLGGVLTAMSVVVDERVGFVTVLDWFVGVGVGVGVVVVVGGGGGGVCGSEESHFVGCDETKETSEEMEFSFRSFGGEVGVSDATFVSGDNWPALFNCSFDGAEVGDGFCVDGGNFASGDLRCLMYRGERYLSAVR